MLSTELTFMMIMGSPGDENGNLARMQKIRTKSGRAVVDYIHIKQICDDCENNRLQICKHNLPNVPPHFNAPRTEDTEALMEDEEEIARELGGLVSQAGKECWDVELIKGICPMDKDVPIVGPISVGVDPTGGSFLSYLGISAVAQPVNDIYPVSYLVEGKVIPRVTAASWRRRTVSIMDSGRGRMPLPSTRKGVSTMSRRTGGCAGSLMGIPEANEPRTLRRNLR